ncbi:beta strand repeat-containing protein, partial [Phenylobacterium sp.]|uniref:beta strand repeat-containing protein n=1 Tax=Phenylobacterium sp. TaxID=1871053 RepID=UPI003983A569
MADLGSSGSSISYGTAADDHLNGGAGNDQLFGLGGSDKLNAGAGADTVDGGAGSDRVSGDSGDDVAVYAVGENAGASDVYDGGSGVDVLRLVMTRTEWLSAAVQQDVAGYLSFIAAATNPNNGQASNAEYVFRAFGLNASKFERLEVVVDGVTIDPRDQAVVLGADAMVASEDAPSLALDVLLNDSVPDLVASLSFTQPAHGTATLVARTSGAGAGAETAKFVYTPSPTHWQYLAAGETATDSFTYKVTDADGDQQTATVTVTITGANDAPTITSAVSTGATVEDGAMSADGVIAFADVDLSNSHAVTATPNATGYLGVFSTAVTNASTGDGAGAVGWAFTVDPATIQHLAKDQVATQLYTVTVADNHGGSVQQVVAVTITGTNDAPTISAATTATGAVTERADGASDENTATLTASGAVAFADVDLTDTHSATFTPAGPGYIGALTLGTVDQAANTVGWTFATADGALDFLAAGETRTQTYVLTVSDGQGGSASQTLTMTLTGSNDAPTITSALATAATVEDGVMSAAGSVAFADVDLADTHTVASAAQANGYFGTFAATASDAATGDGAGSVGWTFSVDPATIQQLAKDQVLTQLYTITVADNQGGSVQQVVAVTITGANDAPVAGTDTLTGATENQTLTFDVLANDTDVDAGAQLTLVSVTGPPGK